MMSRVVQRKTQLANRGVEIVVENAAGIVRPQPFEKCRARHEIVRALEEHLQHAQRHVLQMDTMTASPQFMCSEVELEKAEAKQVHCNALPYPWLGVGV